MSYTEDEIKILKGEKQLAYGCSLAVLGIGFLLNLAYFLVAEFSIHWQWVLLIDFSLLCFIIVIPYSMNRNYNKDLETQRKTIVIENVEKKETITSYHRGRITKDEYYITMHGIRHNVSEVFYKQVKEGSPVEIHYSKYSTTTLSYRICVEKIVR